MKNLVDYSYLWNSTDDGWVLLCINRDVLLLTVKFSAEGPSLKEVAALRTAIPEFRSMSPGKAFAALKGKTEVSLGQFESKEGRHLVERCKACGLVLDTVSKNQSGYLPFNEKTNMTLLIEDNWLAEQVYREALAHGIRVRHVEA
jgi:hypothetical protein